DLSVLVRGYCKRPLAVVIGEGSKGSASHGRAALGNRELADLEAAASTPFRQVPELQTSFAGAGCQHERGVGREQGQGFEGNGAPRISESVDEMALISHRLDLQGFALVKDHPAAVGADIKLTHVAAAPLERVIQGRTFSFERPNVQGVVKAGRN